MAITYRGASNAVGQNAGVTTSAGTVSITPTLPASTAAGDRVFVVACGSNTSGTTPLGWTVVGTKDTIVGSGAVAAAGGLRYMTVYYRDYLGSTAWQMPAFTLTSATQNSHWIGAVSITPTSGSSFNTPTITTVGAAYNATTTSYTDTSAASFTTHTNGFLIVGSCFNTNPTSSAVAVTQSGATLGTVTERCDGGTATGNDVAGKIHTASVTTGASATITQTQTLSATSQGETLFVEQTESVAAVRVVQAFADSGNGFPRTFQNTVTAGNTVIVVGDVQPSSAPVYASPTLGGSSVAGSYAVWNDSGTQNAIYVSGNATAATSVWVLPNCPAANTVDFGTKAGGGQTFGFEVTGLGSAPVVNKSSEGTSPGGLGTAVSSGASGNTTTAPVFIIGAAMVSAGASAAAAGFTVLNWDIGGWAGYQIATTAGSSYTWAQTADSDNNFTPWTAGVAAIVAASATVAAKPRALNLAPPMTRSNLY